MRLEQEQFWSFTDWLLTNHGLLDGFKLALVLIVLGFVITYMVAMVRHGPGEGFYVLSKNIRDLFLRDLPNTTARRTFAIAKLAFKEAIRRKVLAVVAIFIVGLMFAGWYLDPASDDPVRLYISFVLTATNYLVLLLGLYLSSFSLPSDIKNKTIYTITTKPVRATEIVLGRIVGFGMIGSVILLVLGLLSYVFVLRGLRHSHEIERVATAEIEGETTVDLRHSHTIREGASRTLESKGHYHQISNDGTKEVVGEPRWPAKVPVYGTMSYTDRDGKRGEGLNVGYMSDYQKYIAGATLMSAIWVFDDVTESRFGDSLRLEMTLGAFRTVKGDIVTPVRGALIFRSTDGSVESERTNFQVKEFEVDEFEVPREMNGFVNGEAKAIDLYEDLAKDGKLEIIIRCEDTGQYLGMAQADLLLRAGDRPFGMNFLKGYISIWLQMMIVISMGVMFSTFLSGSVAIVATLAALALGFFGSSIDLYFTKPEYSGGGPIEASIRMVTQKGSMHELDLGNAALETVIRNIDMVLMHSVKLMTGALPDFNRLGTADFIAYGIDLFDGLLLRHIVIAFGYFVMTLTIGYFFLKTREIAA